MPARDKFVYLLFCIVYCTCSVWDFAVSFWLITSGTAREANPIVLFVLDFAGWEGLLLWKAAWAIVVLFAVGMLLSVCPRAGYAAIIISLAVYVFLAAYLLREM